MRKKVGFLAVIACLASLCGCLAPKYQRPATPTPPSWPASAGSVTAGQAVPDAGTIKWREFFTDQRLQSVIALALANNRDLRMAVLNVERARAIYRIQRAQQYPQVDAAATGQLYRLPGKMSPTGKAYTYEQYNVGLSSTVWELDLFGRIRSLKKSALEQYFATEQVRSATQISLIAAVADTYLTLAADREDLRLAQATLEAQQASYDLIQQTRNAGMASDLDLRQAQSQVEAARVDIARYTGQVALDENALDLVVGTSVPAELLPSELGSEQSLKDVSAGLPSNVLLQRPDILAAEHLLKAAYANIGAARAAFFPQITLTGGGGVMSSELSNLFKAESDTWNFYPNISVPIFDAGSRRASLKAAKVDRDLAVAGYEKSIQAGFREVSDSLTLRSRLLEQQQAQQALVTALDETYQLSQVRYKAGIDSYLSVLVAQRSLYGAQQALVGVRLARQSNLVTLYKVLGGGA
jgi:multidrug efflux system outer membrane protein